MAEQKVRIKYVSIYDDKGSKKAEKGLKTVNKEAKITTQTMEKIGGAITAAFGAQLITKTVRGLVNVNLQLLEVGARAQGVQKAFNLIAGADLSQLRDSVKGTVSDLTLMESAVKADKFGIPIQKMGSLLQFAAQSAKDTGENVDMLASKISTAIGRKSLLILDDFGITASQIKKELGGMSAEAASVEQLTDAVLRISEATMKNADTAFDSADAYNKLLATVENVKLQGGGLLVNSKELKETIEDLTSTIVTNAPGILNFVTDWGKGAIKLANTFTKIAVALGETYGLIDENAGKSQVQLQTELVSGLRDEVNERKAALKELNTGYNWQMKNRTAESAKIQEQIDLLEGKIRFEQMLLNDAINLSKAEDKLAKAKNDNLQKEADKKKALAIAEEKALKRQIELEKEKSKAKGYTGDVSTNPLFKQGNLGFGGGLFNAESQRIGDFGNALYGSMYGIDTTQGSMTDEQKQQVEQDRKDAEDKQRQLQLEQQQAYYSASIDIVNSSQYAMLDTITFFADQSIATFTNMSQSVINSIITIMQNMQTMQAGSGGFSGIGALGLIGAGIGLIGGIASALTQENEPAQLPAYTGVSSDGITASAGGTNTSTQKAIKPQQTINNYFTTTLSAGNVVGEGGMRELATTITDHQKEMARFA